MRDASLMSRSATDGAQTNSNANSDGANPIEVAFPLFDEITKKAPLPSILAWVAEIFALFQSLIVSFWIGNLDVWPEAHSLTNFVAPFASLSPAEIIVPNVLTSLTVCLVFVGVIGVSLGFQAFYYTRYRKFLQPSLYPTRIGIEVFPLISVVPLGFCTGQWLVLVMSRGEDSIYYALAALMGFLWILTAGVLYYASDFLNSAAYLSRSPFSCFQSRRHSMFMISNSIFLFLNTIFEVFPPWPNFFLMAAHFAMTVIFFRRCWDLIFVRLSAAVVVLAFLVGDLVSGVLAFVLLITKIIVSPWVPFGVGVGLVVVFIGVFAHLVNRKEKALKISLSYNGEVNVHDAEEEITFVMTDADKQDRMHTLGLRNRGKCIAAILCGFRNGCDLFIDFSLIKFAVAEFDDGEMLAFCLRIMISFPSEYRQTNVILREIQKLRNVPLSTRFLVHQIEKIRVIRQSSSSALATEKLKQIRSAISECEDLAKGLWIQKRLYYPMFGKLCRDIQSVHARCQEAVADFPHSVPHAEAFVEFLVECATDFSLAVIQKNRLDLLRAGRSRAIDYCYKAMIVVYPLYLKKRILDTKGAFIRRDTKNTSGMQSQASSSSSTHESGTGSSSLELDATLEEALGKQLMIESRTRLAVQGALQEKTAYSMKPLMVYLIWMVILSIGIAFYGYFGFASFFDNRVDLMARGDFVTECRTNLGGVAVTLLFYWGNGTTNSAGAKNMDLTVSEYFYQVEDKIGLWVYFDSPYSKQTSEFLQKAQAAWNQLEQAITQLAATTSDNIYQLFPRIFQEIVNTTLCADGSPLNMTQMNLKSIFSFAYMQAQIAAGTTSKEWYHNFTSFCHFMNTFPDTCDALAGLRESDRATTSIVGEDDKAYLELLQWLVPVIYGVFGFLPFPVVVFLVMREMKTFCALIESIPLEQKRTAVLPLMKQSDDQRKPQGELQQTRFDSTAVFVIVVMIFLFGGLLVMTAMVFTTSVTATVDFEHGNVWSYFIGRTQPQVIEILAHTYQLIFVSGNVTTNITSVEKEKARVLELARRADVATSALLDGSDLGPSILGSDPIVDEVFLMEDCDPSEHNDTDFHSSYRCANLAHLLVLYTGVVATILDEFLTYEGQVRDLLPVNVNHLVSRHLLSKMQTLQSFFTTRIGDVSDRTVVESTILLVGAIVVSFVAALLGVLFRNAMAEIYGGMLAFLRRCSPAAIVANTPLLNYLLDVTAKEAVEMTPTQNIIHNSSGGIVCIGINGTIESVSAGVTNILGYIPEQLLGQHAIILMTQPDGAKLQQRMEMMIRKECPRNFTDTVQCTNESDAAVACSMTLMGIDSGDGDLGSFVLILKDITNLVKQQEEAEIAKAQSEKLLYEILPRDIVNRINQQEKDITFVVNSATLMFMDIQKFSQYAANLTPQEIMGNLSLIFGGFDSLLPKYPLITKIKLIGDVYMCAAGLFNPDDEPEKHAEQMIRFALEALRVLEETNVKLGANLAIRIGINTGGPIIAGVLGTDKPVFDIIGDPINIAARLQSTCVAGRVQISEDTFTLVRGHGFMIEPRGEVFLKGKGNRPAYLVSPSTGFALELSGAGSKVFSATPK